MANVKMVHVVHHLVIVMMILMTLKTTLVLGQNSTRNETSSSKLRILVPVRPGLNDFVSIERHPVTGVQNFSGFAIRVFQGIVDFGLPSPVLYDFEPFAKPDGSMNGSFDDMLQAVASQDYDGVVGEISILHYRTPWVDFTLPYLNSQISMLVRIKQQPIKGDITISLASATKYIVAATLAFSFVVAISFWFLEYRTDKHASQPSDTGFSDDLRSDILRSITQTRLVVILFFMVMLILLACYSASQTASLTAQHRGASGIKNIDQLIRNKLNVGHRQGSFIRNLLIQKGIPESKLISLESEEEMTEMLSKGTAKGGVDAIFGDSPNLHLFLANHTSYCDTFTVVPASDIDTVGFGFAFHKETSLANEFSEGLLKLIDTGRLTTIQQQTIGSLDSCESDDDIVGSEQLLDSDSFWILIAGAIAVIILMIIIVLLYCGLRRNGRKKKAVAYPCYLLPCC